MTGPTAEAHSESQLSWGVSITEQEVNEEYPYLGFEGLRRPDIETWTEEYLRMWLAQDLRASIKHYALMLGSARDVFIEGSSTNSETGKVIKGVLRSMRMMGRNICFFVELDPGTDQIIDDGRIDIDEFGHLNSDGTSMLTLTKAAAVCSPENSRPVTHERFLELQEGASWMKAK